MKYARLISKMTLEEKASLMSGADFWHTKAVERLGIAAMMLTDGPHGLRKQIGKADHLGLNAAYPATCFPTASCAANSWDEELIEQMGRRLGAEARAQRVSVVLGPGVNIKRSPLCGRNFEYYSEDPLLAGKCAAALIRGIQSQGVAACGDGQRGVFQRAGILAVDAVVLRRHSEGRVLNQERVLARDAVFIVGVDAQAAAARDDQIGLGIETGVQLLVRFGGETVREGVALAVGERALRAFREGERDGSGLINIEGTAVGAGKIEILQDQRDLGARRVDQHAALAAAAEHIASCGGDGHNSVLGGSAAARDVCTAAGKGNLCSGILGGRFRLFRLRCLCRLLCFAAAQKQQKQCRTD